MEGVRDHTHLTLIHCPRQHRLQTSKMNYKRFEVFSEDLVAVELFKPTIILNKPIYIGASVLDLSKAHMYNAFYNILRKEFPTLKLVFSGWYPSNFPTNINFQTFVDEFSIIMLQIKIIKLFISRYRFPAG